MQTLCTTEPILIGPMSAVPGRLVALIGRGLGDCDCLQTNLTSFPHPALLLLWAGHNTVEVNQQLKDILSHWPRLNSILNSKLLKYRCW